jgi:hypothetical protein
MRKKIQIMKCSNQAFWYRTKVGKHFIVDISSDNPTGLYRTGLGYLLKDDCEVVPDIKPIKSLPKHEMKRRK